MKRVLFIYIVIVIISAFCSCSTNPTSNPTISTEQSPQLSMEAVISAVPSIRPSVTPTETKPNNNNITWYDTHVVSRNNCLYYYDNKRIIRIHNDQKTEVKNDCIVNWMYLDPYNNLWFSVLSGTDYSIDDENNVGRDIFDLYIVKNNETEAKLFLAGSIESNFDSDSVAISEPYIYFNDGATIYSLNTKINNIQEVRSDATVSNSINDFGYYIYSYPVNSEKEYLVKDDKIINLDKFYRISLNGQYLLKESSKNELELYDLGSPNWGKAIRLQKPEMWKYMAYYVVQDRKLISIVQTLGYNTDFSCVYDFSKGTWQIADLKIKGGTFWDGERWWIYTVNEEFALYYYDSSLHSYNLNSKLKLGYDSVRVVDGQIFIFKNDSDLETYDYPQTYWDLILQKKLSFQQ